MNPANQDRQIRVFISSTFRDMQAERDYLVKFIFPQLRKLCESRGVTWGEVDLRWGVTDEQAAEGKVLPICLEEIKRCRPYFIGLLGERYGWIPETLPADLVEQEKWLEKHLHGKTSVTELEILHGVLNDPKMAGHAYFYFRDPSYLKSIPEKDRKAFTVENARDEEKLRSLKENIRHSGFPVYENYPDPKALGELVLADLTKVINENWPEGSQPDPLDREAMDHEAYAQSRERVYIGRQEYFDRLDTHAAARDNQPLVILGESGSGKSALLSNWVAHYRQEHPDTLVIQHYIGARPYSADWAAMLRRLMGEFKRRLDIRQDIPDQPDALRSAFPNWLYMAGAKVRSSEFGFQSSEKTAETATCPSKIVIVLDALNQLEDRDGAPDLVWLPPALPENVRLIVSTLPGRPLDEIQKRNWTTLKVELLSADERRKLIAEYLAQHAKSLNAARVERIAAAPPSASPLYLRVLLDELRLVRTHEELEERIGDYLKAESPHALYEKVIVRWEQDYEGDSDLVGDTLSLLWAARRGLTETELLQALGKDGEPLPRAKWSPLFLAMSDALISRGGLLTFAHDFLRQAVENVFAPTCVLQKAAHLAVANYFIRERELYPHKIDELFWQLQKAEAWDMLIEHLQHTRLMQETWALNQFDVTCTWTALESAVPGSLPRAYDFILNSPDGYVWQAGKHSGAADYLTILAETFRFCGYPNESFKLCDAVIKNFEDGDILILWRAVALQCKLFIDRGRGGDLQTAWNILLNFCEIAGVQENRRLLGRIMSIQETILLTCEQNDEALDVIREHKKLIQTDEIRDGLADCLGNEAVALTNKGDFEAALTCHREEERLCREQDDLDGLQASLGNQAGVLGKQGLYEEALVLLAKQEQICSQIGTMTSLANCFSNQAFAHAQRGRRDLAIKLLKQQEHLARRMGSDVQLRIAIEAQKHLSKQS